MDFRYSEDIEDLREGARTFFETENDAFRLRSLAEGADPLALWPKLAEMGLLGVCAPEDAGGLGLGTSDVQLFSEEAGRSGLPEPYSDVAAVLVPVLAALGDTAGLSLTDIVASVRP